MDDTTLPGMLDPQFETAPDLSRRTFLGLVGGSMLATSVLPGIATASVKPQTESYWRWIADQFMLRPGITYMNTGTRGPSPLPVFEAQVNAIAASNQDRLSYARHVYNADYKTGLRTKLASFVGADPDEIALTNNTTEGMVIGTMGLDMKPGDEIIYTNHDHSSGAQPINLRCARYGTVAKVVDLSSPDLHPARSKQQIIDAFEAAITPRTRLISLCHINYTDGCLMPVKEICDLARSKGIFTLVDGAHPPGMLDLNVKDLGCDMYAGACHKWMMAAQLTGFFYVRQELLDQVWPAVYSGTVNGKNMYGAEVETSYQHTAEKFEKHGSYNYAAGIAVDAAIDFHNSIGKQAIEERSRYLADITREGLADIPGVRVHTSADYDMCAGLVAFKLDNMETKVLSDRLWDAHQIYIRNVTHEEIGWDVNRASLHIMVTREQVDDCIEAVRELATA